MKNDVYSERILVPHIKIFQGFGIAGWFIVFLRRVVQLSVVFVLALTLILMVQPLLSYQLSLPSFAPWQP